MNRQRIATVGTTLLASSLALSSAFAGEIHCVDSSKTYGSNNGGCWVHAYWDLEDALDAATSGDQIWVAKGTGPYIPSHRIDPGDDRSVTFVMRDGVAIYGGFEGDHDNEIPGTFDPADRNIDANETILSGDLDNDDDYATCDDDEDCSLQGNDYRGGYCMPHEGNDRCIIQDNIGENAYQVVRATYTNDGTLLDGFTIRGGYGKDGSVSYKGAGVYVGSSQHLDIRNCKIEWNASGNDGGGVYFGETSAGLVEHTNLFYNFAYGEGGGVAINSDLALPAPVTISDCDIFYNGADGYAGGGLKLSDNSQTGATAVVKNSTIQGNRAPRGGGIGSKIKVTADIINCKILENRADTSGGGIYTYGAQTLQIVNTLFAGNTAREYGAMYTGKVSLINVTVADNHATDQWGGVGCAGSGGAPSNWAEISNSIFWGNTHGHSDPKGKDLELGSHTHVQYSDVEGGRGGVGGLGEHLHWILLDDHNIDLGVNPKFVDPTVLDYSCKASSTMIDRGTNVDFPSGVTLDVAGKARMIDDPDVDPNLGNPTSGATVDLGAHEFNGPFSGPPGDDGFGTMNRYLSVVPGSRPTPQAVRVTYADTRTPPKYPAIVGESWWIGEPFEVTEASCCDGSTPPPTFMAATMICVDVESQVDPPYVDFSAWHGTCVSNECSGGKKDGQTCGSDADCLDVLYIYATEILPDAEYEIALIAEGKDYTVETNFTEVPLVVTSIFGDVVGDCGPRPCTPPQGIVDFVDLCAVVEKFRNLPAAGRKARADVVNSDVSQTVPDQKIDFVDISAIVSQFKNQIPVPALPEPVACQY